MASPESLTAEHQKQVRAKSDELAAARQRRDAAEAALSAARGKLLEFDQKLKAARAAGEERDRLIAQCDTTEQELQRKVIHYNARKAEAERMAYPAIPSEADVKSDGKPDRRPVYSIATGVGVFALFMMALMLSGGSKDERAASQAFEGQGGGGAYDDVAPVPPARGAHRHRQSPVEA
jgi:hypothetical protein